jgi:chromosome segregation ATPase
MRKSLWFVLMAGAVMALVGCSNKPSAEELQQLEALKAEVASLERQISTLESERASLMGAIAEKDAKLSQCEQEKTVVQQRLRTMQ